VDFGEICQDLLKGRVTLGGLVARHALADRDGLAVWWRGVLLRCGVDRSPDGQSNGLTKRAGRSTVTPETKPPSSP
jgi:hypothetical protein